MDRQPLTAVSCVINLKPVRKFEPVGNALCGVPARSAASRNGTEAVPYKGLRRPEFPDTLT